jgi:hypothetical protein
MYVVGYGVKSEIKQRKGCESCRELLVIERKEGDELQALPVITTDEILTDNAYDFLEEVNRGGLREPTPAAFSMGMKAWVVFEAVENSPILRKEFWREECGGSNKKTVFARIVKSLLEKDGAEEGVAVTTLQCSNGHDICTGLAARLFSCMTKNYLKRTNAEAKAEVERKRNDRKKTKLQSTSNK